MAEIKRAKDGRPYIIPPDGGKPVLYSRASKFGDVLDDTYFLDLYHQRNVALGMSQRPDLALYANSMFGEHEVWQNKQELNKLCATARTVAGEDIKANNGNAYHKFTERIDNGEEVTNVPEHVGRDLQAYLKATEKLEIISTEQFVVNDGVRAAGTFDRLMKMPGGELVIGDVKTGNIELGITKIAVQLAIYANGEHYFPDTEGGATRVSHGADLGYGVIIHLPVGQARCELIPVDLEKGYQDLMIAARVHGVRSQKFKYYTEGLSLELGVA